MGIQWFRVGAVWCITVALVVLGGFARAQGGPELAPTLDAQRQAMAALHMMDGEWRGPAWVMGRDGKRRDITQTERIGTTLGGTIRVVEGRGFNDDGTPGFHAFGVLSFDPATKAYSLTSWAQGRYGQFPLTVRPDGYSWSVPAGPKAVVRYTATIAGDSFREIGEYMMEGQPPRLTFEMNLTRVGPTQWPAAGGLGPQ